MKKSSETASGNENTKVIQSVDYVNLQDFGYEKAGTVKGDPEIYASYLQRIINGDLVEENYKGITDEQKKEKREKLNELDKDLTEINKSNEKIEKEIKEKQDKIDKKREELLTIHEKHEENEEALLKDTFSPLKFSISLFILVMLTGYLFFFYVSAAYKALYIDFEKIASNMAQGLGTGSIMPQPVELAEAMRFNFLLFLVPFVFYAFGWAFHVFLDMKNQLKVLYLGLLIAVTFTVDFLLALIIHNNTEQAKELMGLATKSWTASSTFYVILFLGFLVYIVWSILLDYMLGEWGKRKITLNIKKIIKHLRNDVKDLEKKLIQTDHLKNEVAFLRDEIDTVVQGNLKGYIDQFTTGWISYLSPQNLKEMKTKCMNLKKDFEDKHQIKPGVIKVVKRRK
jgi:hypothetical protein